MGKSVRRVRGHSQAVAIGLSTAAVSATVRADSLRGGWHDGWGWGHMFFGSFMMLLFWGALIVLVVLAVRWFGHGSTRVDEKSSGGSRALEILEERFARGEIDKEEFEERRRTLSS